MISLRNLEIRIKVVIIWGLPGWLRWWKSACSARDLGSIPGSGRSSGEGNGLPTPVFLPGKFHGQRNLVGYSAWGRKEWYNWAHTHTHTHTHTGLKSFLSFLVSGEISPVFSCFFNLTSCPCHQVSVQILLQVGLHELRLIPQVWAYLCRVYKDLTVPHTNLGECSPGLEKPLQNQYICWLYE